MFVFYTIVAALIFLLLLVVFRRDWRGWEEGLTLLIASLLVAIFWPVLLAGLCVLNKTAYVSRI